MREKVEYFFVKTFLYLAKVLPSSFLYPFIKGLTLLVYYADKRRRFITIRNLSMAYPDKSSKEIKYLSKKVYIELSKTISEILLMFVNRFDIDNAIINKDEIIEKLQQLVENSPQGVIVMTAHFSNWELLVHFLSQHGLSLLAVERKGNNKLIEKNITVPFRRKYGNSTTIKKAMFSMIKVLKKGGNLGILMDQKYGHLNGVKVDFFNRTAEIITSIAMLKMRYNPKVIPCFAVRVDNGKYKIIMQESIEYMANEENDEEKKIEKMTALYNQTIEKVIREYPSQWFWMHNRWRI